MAITDTITTIKDYFLNWHKEKYEILHEKKTTQVTNQQPNRDLTVTSGAVYDYVNNKIDGVTTCSVKMCNNTGTTLQTTLDQFDNTLKNKVNKDQYSNADISFYSLGTGGISTIDCTNTQNGLMKWQEKILLHELATWHTISVGLPPKTSMSVNVILGLVHLHLYYPNCTKFKKSTSWEYIADGDNALQQFLPTGHVSVPLGNPNRGGILTISNTGGFKVDIPSKKNSTTIVADVLYKYTTGQSIPEDNFDFGTRKRTMYDRITEM